MARPRTPKKLNPGDLMDSDGNVCPASAQPKLRVFLDVFPEVIARSTPPEIYIALKALGVWFPE